MKSMTQFISEETIYALAWTVLHSLWQGLLIALVFSLVYYNLKNKSSRFKYHLAIAALFAIVFSSAYTFVSLNKLDSGQSLQEYSVPTTVIASADTYQMALKTNASNWFEISLSFLDNNSKYVVGIWVFGLFFFVLKMLFGLYSVNQIRFSAETIIDKSWQEKIDKFLVNLGSRKSVEIAQSSLIKIPMMIGFFKPMILFPVGVINQMDAKEVEAIIAHELSHVLRNDYFMNIIQTCVEVLFYFNPAVWWISSIVRSERENACDDMAINLTHSNVDYAKALLNLGYQQSNSNSLVMSFGGKKKKLLNRVQRILNNSQHKPRVMEKIITSILLLVLIVGISMGANTKDSPAHKTTIETNDLPNSIFIQNENEEKEYILIDTLPNPVETSCQMMYYNDDKRVDIWKESGKIIKLWVDGVRIDEKDFHKYQAYIDEAPSYLLERTNKLGQEFEETEFDGPKPPVPPTPPSAPAPPAPPRAPAHPASPTSPAHPAPPINPNKGNINDLGMMLEEQKALQMELSQLALEEYQRERERIMHELKSLSEITLIDSLHPTLKMLETEDGLAVLNFENGKALEFENNIVFKDYAGDVDLLVAQLNEQTHELNRKMARIDEDIMIQMEESSAHMQELLESTNDIMATTLSDLGGIDLAIQNAQLTHRLNNDNLNSVFETNLLLDGLIKSRDSYNFKITNDYFKINGKKVSKDIHNKYLNIIKAERSAYENQKIKYSRSIKGDNRETSIQISRES